MSVLPTTRIYEGTRIPSPVPTILEVVCRTTGMGFAAVARVTEDRWIACEVHDEIQFGLRPGGELEVETDELFYADDHSPELGHEYQFDLSLEDAQHALERTISFAQTVTRR